MRYLILILTLLTLIGCAARKVPGFYGGDGSSKEQAVEIVGYEYSSYHWIERHFPGATIMSQELVIPPDSKKEYDVITFKTATGEIVNAWFLLSGGPGSVWD